MLKANGLYGYIQNNNLKSWLLFLGFLVSVQLMMAAIYCWVVIYAFPPLGFIEFLKHLSDHMISGFLPVLAASLVWVAIAFYQFKNIVRSFTGLHGTERRQEIRLYNIVENLSISVGLSTPKIEIAESHGLNAFAMGLSPETSTIGVTRGLLNTLDDKELEAVIAHELTHINAYDVRLVTLATIFCGIVFSVTWIFTYGIREFSRQIAADPQKYMLGLALLACVLAGLFYIYTPYGILLSLIFISLALLTGLGLRMLISQTREFVADAGAIELTKNPEALISALLKIEGRSLIDNGDVMLRSMMISAPSNGLNATHPAIEDRIDAIVSYAAQSLRGLKLAPASQRLIPYTDENGLAAGFSITKMKYPAWISKPIIVFPSLLTGALVYLVTQNSLGNFLLSIPNWPSDIWQWIATPNITRYDHDHPAPAPGAFSLEGFGGLSGYFLWVVIAAPLAVVIKKLINSGYIRNDDYARSVSDKLAKTEERGWDDDRGAPNMAMNVTAGNSPPNVQQFGQRPMFGASINQTEISDSLRASYRATLNQAPNRNATGLKAITSLIPSRIMLAPLSLLVIVAPQIMMSKFGGGAFVDVAPANDKFNVGSNVQQFLLSNVITHRNDVSEAIKTAAYKCAYDLAPNTPAGRAFGAHWSNVYSGVAYIGTFGGNHFPTEEEIFATFIQHEGKGNPVTPADVDNLDGKDQFYQNYWDKGLVGTSVRNECVFQGAYTLMQGNPALKGSL
jgi:heat shock protein HtpX